MAKLAAWSMDGSPVEGSAPKKVERSHVGLEKYLENWIANDVTLIGEGLTLVGQQVKIDDGILDLLAVDTQDRWVVIEIKSGTLDSGALSQALYYASSIARLDAAELREKIEGGLGKFGDPERLLERVKGLLDNEEEEVRKITVLLVGAGVHPGLDRMIEFLGRFGVPIGVVSFEIFQLDSGPKLLIREVVEEPVKPTPARRKLTVEAIRRWAVDAGVGAQFDRFVNMAQAAGLAVQPQRASVRIAPPSNRTRFLMYARPHSDEDGGALLIHVGPKEFAEFFRHINETEAIEDLKELDGKYLAGKDLDEALDQIERFLTDKVQQPTVDGG